MRKLQSCFVAPALGLAVGCGASGETGAAAGGAGGAPASSGPSAPGTTITSSGSGGTDDIPGFGTALFFEKFDDADFAARGWYDDPGGTIATTSHADGSASSFECSFLAGGTSCAGGRPGRIPFVDIALETLYLGFWLKFSASWVGSVEPDAPAIFQLLTNEDDDLADPAATHLTVAALVAEGRAVLALQDSLNVDASCILLNDDAFVGCNGDFASYAFTEDRSACACNGLAGEVDGRDCTPEGSGWHSARSWTSAEPAFGEEGARLVKTSWHYVEIYLALNSIERGVGVADGKIRWVEDGQTLVSSDAILFRTGAHPTMTFSQLALLPSVTAGSPVDEQLWIDDLTVATARP
jgi:hypothetical protein